MVSLYYILMSTSDSTLEGDIIATSDLLRASGFTTHGVTMKGGEILVLWHRGVSRQRGSGVGGASGPATPKPP